MDTHPFAKFGRDKYLLNIHSNRFLKTVFQKLWVPFVFLIFVVLGIILVSIIMAGDFPSVIDITIRMFLGEQEYCNTTLEHVAACMLDLGGFLGLPFLVVLSIVGYMISVLSKEIPRSLFEIAASGRIKHIGETNDSKLNTSGEDIDDKKGLAAVWETIKEKYRLRPRSSLTYVEDFESALLSPWRFIFFGFWLLLSYWLSIQMVIEVGLQYAGKPVLIFAGYFFVIVVPIFVAYFIAAWMWFFFIVGYYLRWLPGIFNLEIQPRHGDTCGGLKRLGDICLKMALSIILPAILVGVWVATGIAWKVVVGIPTFALFLIILIMILLVLSFLAFFYPLFGIHSAMVDTNDQFQEKWVAEITGIESRLRMLYEQGIYEGEEIRSLLKQLELAQTLYSTDVRFPTWPFSTPMLLGFFTSQLVPVIGAVKLVMDFTELFN